MVVLLQWLFAVACTAQYVYLWVGEQLTPISNGVEALDAVCNADLPNSKALVCTEDLNANQFFNESFDVVTRNTLGNGWDYANPVALHGSVLRTLFDNSLGTTIKSFSGAVVKDSMVATGCFYGGEFFVGSCGHFTQTSGTTPGGDPTSKSWSWIHWDVCELSCGQNYRVYCIGGSYERNYPFKTRWMASKRNITLPIPDTTGLAIDWGDGQGIQTNQPAIHTYRRAGGSYEISIYGPIKHFRFNFGGDAADLWEIKSWGTGFEIGPLDDYMFAGCTNLNSVPGYGLQPVMLPNASLKGMFMNSSFRSPLSWDLTNVASLDSMFAGAKNFNQPLKFKNTQSVVSMVEMFANTRFNQPINFSASSLLYVDGMFRNAVNFNSPVTLTSSTSLQSTTGMFQGARLFNQPLVIDTGNVTNMDSMFEGASSFNQAVSFDTSRVQSMNRMFALASKFTQTVNFSSVSNVVDMEGMFLNVSSGFKQDFRSWDTSAVMNCSQFCSSCGLPSFPLCCGSGERNCSQISQNSTMVLNSSNLTATVNLPPEVLRNGTVNASLLPGTNATVSNSIVSIVLQDGFGNTVNVSNLSTPVHITFALKIPVNPNAVSQCLGTTFVVEPVLPTCSYLNEDTSVWETAGCQVASFNATHVQCNCTHFTLFGVTAPKFNELVPDVFRELTISNLVAHPIGVILVFLMLVLFAIMFGVAVLGDRKEAAQCEQLKLSKHEEWKKFAADKAKMTLLSQVKLGFQKRHTWFALAFRKSGTSFRSVDRTFVTLLSAFASMSMSAFYHAQDNNDMARVEVIAISVMVCAVSSQLLTLLFVRTGPVGFYEEWEQSRRPPKNKCLAYRFPSKWRHVWRISILIVVFAMIVYVLAMSVNFDRQPFYFCRGEAALAWVGTWLLAYMASVLLLDPLRIVLLALGAHFTNSLRRYSSRATEMGSAESASYLALD